MGLELRKCCWSSFLGMSMWIIGRRWGFGYHLYHSFRLSSGGRFEDSSNQDLSSALQYMTMTNAFFGISNLISIPSLVISISHVISIPVKRIIVSFDTLSRHATGIPAAFAPKILSSFLQSSTIFLRAKESLDVPKAITG